MKYLLSLIIIVVVALCSACCRAQNAVDFTQLKGENVTTQSITYAVEQDAKGNIWIASEEGILRYNSANLTIYNSYNGIPEILGNRHQSLFIDAQDRIWAGSEKGLSQYNEDLDAFEMVPSALDINPSNIKAITQDASGTIWVAGFNGLWRVSQSEESPNINRLLDNLIIEDVETYGEMIILGTKQGLFLFNPITDTIESIFLPQETAKSISSLSKVNRTIWVGTDDGVLFTINSSLDNLVPAPINVSSGFPIKDILSDSAGAIYVATDGDGLFTFSASNELVMHHTNNENKKNSLSSNGVYDLTFGKEGFLWLATYGGGINYYDTTALPFIKVQHEINEPNSLVSDFTRAIAIDKKGRRWFGTKNGVSIWDVDSGNWMHIRTLSRKRNTNPDIVLALESAGDFMWVGTYNDGLYRVNIDSLEATSIRDISTKEIASKVYAIKKDSAGAVWVGGLSGDLAVIYPNNDVDTYSIQQLKSFYESNDGTMLAVGRNGVFNINGKEKTFKRIEQLSPSESALRYSTINSVVQDSKGHIVLGTNGSGLVFYAPENDKLHKINLASGMPSDIVQGIIKQEDGIYWASTTKGLAHISITENDTLIQVFTEKDGLAGTEFNYGAYKKISDNLFAFGGVEGVTLFNPDRIVESGNAPVIHFDEFRLFNDVVEATSKPLGKHINQTDIIELESDENSISFKFIGISHSSANRITYSWKLEGFQDDWSEPSVQNVANYTNLPSGEYIFKVRAANKYDQFGEERQIVVQISTPWYLCWWAFIIYGLMAIGIFLLIVHFTKVIVNKRNADEQIDFYNNITHEIKTPLTILMSSLDNSANEIDGSGEETRKRIKTTIGRVNGLFEQMLNFHKVTSTDRVINDVTEISINRMVQKMIYNFDPMIKERGLEIKVNNHWTGSAFYFDKEVLRKIFLNLFSNAVKYSKDGGLITLNISKTKSGDFEFQIADQGLGIPKDQQVHILKKYYRARNVINSQRPGTGLGLMMVKNIIDKIGGNISFKSEENVGTTFTVVLKNLIALRNDERVSKHDMAQSIVSGITEQTDLEDYSDKKILIVEDNDELRENLIDTLGVYFQVYEASNGVEGLKIASEVFPDIILTDLIMPEMDGMQMAKLLKDDINLNHIPVFMLTVLQNSIQKLESIKSGISEYIEKPINMDFLFAKIVNTLKTQKKLQKKYIQEGDADSAQNFRNKKDRKFLKKLKKNIIENIADGNFSVHDLSKNFGMSRTSLYMKLKNLVDLSPQDFIIDTKLKYSKKLLIKGDMSIKEVAYNSGFSNPKYFSTSFKKFYGMTPTSFIESLKKSSDN
ncbi:response regulator [Dokdonia sinensis]|uniref:histidine kinase n=1 Tax=Dokdonia sinensis TaxID=2479847 RepID=A0A3M0GHK9_9FLAO|nr:ATP-binding protein [Dokdonia sinensis]RMB64164.1 response regulator [Dokdonia sinensis]